MSALPVTPDQIRAIHAIKSRTGLADSSYRAMLSAYDVASSKDLGRADADALLKRMRDIPGASTPVERARATGRYAGKLQAMWLALFNLGAVEDRRDGALHAFLERQAGIQHTRFLREASEAHKAIEALKAWLIREGVVWPEKKGDPGLDRLAMKRAILDAQCRRLIDLGEIPPYGPIERAGSAPEGLDRLAKSLGAKIRKAKAPQEARRAR